MTRAVVSITEARRFFVSAMKEHLRLKTTVESVNYEGFEALLKCGSSQEGKKKA